MAKLPEDIRLAVEGLSVLEEKFLSPLRRLHDVVRVCLESQQRVEDAENKLKTVQQAIAEAQRQGIQQAERAQTRLKVLGEQLLAVQAQWAQEETAHKEKLSDFQRHLAQAEAEYTERCRRRDQLAEEITVATTRLQELRERIKRAQTLEP